MKMKAFIGAEVTRIWKMITIAVCHPTLMLTSPIKVHVLCGDRNDVTVFLQSECMFHSV